jgi:hypothetical protein
MWLSVTKGDIRVTDTGKGYNCFIGGTEVDLTQEEFSNLRSAIYELETRQLNEALGRNDPLPEGWTE